MSINKKQLIIVTLLLASNVALGFWWHLIPQRPLFAIFALSSGLLWTLFVLIAEDRALFFLISIVSILLLMVGIHIDIWSMLGLIFGMIFAAWAFSVARNTYHSNIKFSTKTIVGRSLRIYFTAIIVVFTFAYFGAASSISNTSSLILPEEVFLIGMRISEKPLQAILPGINIDNTIDEALAVFMQTQLKRAAGSNTTLMPSLLQIKQTIPSQRKDIIRTINKELKVNIDVNTKGTEKLSTVLYRISANKIDEFSKQFSSYIPWILGVGFFFSLKTISIVYYYTSIILASFVIKILISIGIFKMETIPAIKEILK